MRAECLHLFWLCSLLVFVSCSSKADSADTQASDAVLAVQERSIAPTDFVIAPCERATSGSDCLVVAAGGKRILIGAPAGVGAGKIAGDDTPPDAVILFSLHAGAIEGLDEVRNRAWASGRRSPLIVAGADGIDHIVSALNAAYVTSDALAYIEGVRKGGFDTEAMVSKPVKPGDIAFDTGDLTVTVFAAGAGQLALLVHYNGQSVLLAGCGARHQDVETWPIAEVYIGCEQGAYRVEQQGTWPLADRLYILQKS